MQKPHVAVLLGGWSAERPVSLVSGRFCVTALQTNGYHVSVIDVDSDIKKLVTRLEDIKPDVVLNMLHGPFGEDGCIQGLLDMLDIPYSHSGVLASSLAMDKQKTKDILAVHNILSPKGQLLTRAEYQKNRLDIPAPYVAKPNCEGSSFGVHIVAHGDNHSPLDDDEIWGFGNNDSEVLVEEYIPGRELTVSVMGDRALEVTEIQSQAHFYDYGSKYEDGGSVHILPADIPEEIYNAAMEQAVTAHKVLGCTGVTRSDFRYNDTEHGAKGLFFLEINTQPGMTPTSLVPEQALHHGISYQELVSWMVEDPIIRKNARDDHRGDTDGTTQTQSAEEGS